MVQRLLPAELQTRNVMLLSSKWPRETSKRRTPLSVICNNDKHDAFLFKGILYIDTFLQGNTIYRLMRNFYYKVRLGSD